MLKNITSIPQPQKRKKINAAAAPTKAKPIIKRIKFGIIFKYLCKYRVYIPKNPFIIYNFKIKLNVFIFKIN